MMQEEKCTQLGKKDPAYRMKNIQDEARDSKEIITRKPTHTCGASVHTFVIFDENNNIFKET